MPGRFYGVGVGPGDPELLTVKAQRTLRAAPVIAYPCPAEGTRSYALEIVRPHLEGLDKEFLALRFPMTKDPKVVEPLWEKAVAEITARLDQGKDVAFVTEGDPFLYSTFIHLYRRLRARRPDLPVSVIPGVTSLTASAVQAGVPLADRDESIAIIPATYGIEGIEETLEKFDTVILLKVASRLTEVRQLLAAKGLLDHAFLVEKATSPEERVVTQLRETEGMEFHYLTTLIVTRRRALTSPPPLLLLVHGSPVKVATMEMGKVAEEVGRELPGTSVITCHLEHTSPDLRSAVQSLRSQGHDRAIVVPYFVFKAKHLKEEVPELLQDLRESIDLQITDPLWPSGTVVDILEERARHAISTQRFPEKTRLLLVGRGSSDPAIPGVFEGLASELTRRLGTECAVGYSDVLDPRIEQSARALAEKGPQPIVALPVFLSHGQLVGEIETRMRSGMNGQATPLAVAEPLGPDPRLSHLIVQRYQEALRA
jgi:precorrin-2/cobalt-factor-2 C20-methyltransferase